MLSPLVLILAMVGYYLLLMLTSWLTTRRLTRGSENQGFYLSNRQAPWYIVAYGMIGTLLSGVTFISVPGDVGVTLADGTVKGMGYLQFVLGCMAGFWVIAFVLIPLFYRLNLISIYSYLDQRFGPRAYRTGAVIFLVSRTLGSSLRVYLAASVLQHLVFDAWGVPFFLNVLVTMAFILLYTGRGGMRTIIWTDTFQTTLMLLAVLLTFYHIFTSPALDQPFQQLKASPFSQVFFWDWKLPNHFLKQFLGGMFITIVMVGLDQDMMQKNLSCPNAADARKNMLLASGLFLLINTLFVTLGGFLYLYADALQFPMPLRTDHLYPGLALAHFDGLLVVLILLGLVAATYSSADGSLTALTTSVCIDLLNIERRPADQQVQLRRRVHILMTVVFIVCVLMFEAVHQIREAQQLNIVTLVFRIADYTYGPLLGLFAFGILHRQRVQDSRLPLVALLSPLLCLLLDVGLARFLDFHFGFELILLNALFTYIGCWLLMLPTDKAPDPDHF